MSCLLQTRAADSSGVARVDRARRGRSKILTAATAREMTTAQKPGYGLGLSLEGGGRSASFGHGGSNEGFQCRMVAFFEGGRGAVVMTNGARGGFLGGEILRALALEYDWPAFKPVTKTVVAVTPEALRPLTGRYELRPGHILTVTVEGDRLFAGDEEGTVELYPESETRFFDTVEAHVIVFAKDEAGQVTHMVIDGRLKAPRL